DTPTGPSTPSTSTEEVSGQCVTVILKRPKDQQVGTTGCKLLDSQVPGSCILEDQIPGSCISEDQIPGSCILEDQIPGSCISEDQIPGSCISGDQIPDRSISEAQIPGNCISEDQIPGSSGSNRSTQDHFPGRPMTCTGMAGLEEWTDSEQPWYTFLYSPVSLEHSPPDNGVPEGGNIPGRYCEVSAQYHPPYEEEVMGTDALPSEPPGVLPTSPAISCGVLPSSPRTPPTVLSNTQAMQNPEIQHNSFYSFSTPDSVMEPPFSVKMEDRVLTGGIDMGKEGTEGGDGMTEGDGEAWVVADGGQPCVWPIKLNPWYGSQHSRCVSGEETYWLQAGWQPVGSSGMMEDSLGSPGDELIHSPSDEASTSGGKRADSKKCGVCGDRALGYNFNAITCESCKAFFRRNALKNKDFRCPFQESCKVDQVTRRFCQKCRLRKCFDIGMKKEWIMTDEEKQRKKQKIEENRARKMGDAMSDEEGVKNYSSDYTSSPQSEQHMTPASQCGLDHLTGGSLPHAPLEFDRFQNDGPLRTFPPGLTLINPATTISYGETKAGLAKSDQDGADQRDPRETSPHGVDAHAQEDESSPTAYLTQGSLAQVMAFNIKKEDLSNPSLINIINLTEIAIRRLIKMSKRVSAFKSLCQEDQIALLKGGCTELMILRSVCAYDPDKDSWKNIKLKVLKAAPGNVSRNTNALYWPLTQSGVMDHNIIFLLSAITLFNPERPNIIHSDAIKHEQCSYLYLLKRYLECKYGGCEGRTVYHRLLERITHLHILSENHIRVFLEVNPQEVEPLLIEIFDLKQR
ncbi:Nuclear hormone receptor HR96-like 2, partial [Homarus americanus]